MGREQPADDDGIAQQASKKSERAADALLILGLADRAWHFFLFPLLSRWSCLLNARTGEVTLSGELHRPGAAEGFQPEDFASWPAVPIGRWKDLKGAPLS